MLLTSDHLVVVNGFSVSAARLNDFGYSKTVYPIHTEGRMVWFL
jgi:hypothetical protein